MDKHPTNTTHQRAHPAMAADARPNGRGAFGTWLEQRRTERLLTACSDRVLADIGIAREDIPLVARGQDAAQEHPRSGWLVSLRASLGEALAARRSWRRQQAELMAYSDEELADLGISRRDIRSVVRGAADPTPA
jgi:uncharacterized protein YjiS (DUF1127 family)